MNSDYFELINKLVIPATLDTLYMVFFASLFAIFFGLLLGIILYITPKGGIYEMPALHEALNFIVNVGRSIPFVILMIAVFPLSGLLVGTVIGSTATIVPLTIASIPFVGRVIENALLELDKGVIEAAMSFGASNFEVVFKVLIPETAPAIVNGITLTIISIIGYSAMAGYVGGGGLGDVAIRYGFIKYRMDILYTTIVIMVILVQIVQVIGDFVSSKLNKR
ncbi:MAG: methionine ABC transporter permease [Anaerotignum sp.]